MTFRPRPAQQQVLAYTGGWMGVAAVPGSGKTATLSYLAARLVATVELRDGQEILIVTLVKSAVGNFAAAMARYLKEEFNLLPGIGYRVRTLHSLANDIVRERPGLVGLADNFNVLSEREADDLLQDAVETWIKVHPDAPNAWLNDEHFDNRMARDGGWRDAVRSMANTFIRQAKDYQLSEFDVRRRLDGFGMALPLAEMCLSIYEQYERGLRYRGAVDFQDLIRLALRVLDLDSHYLVRLQDRWGYILEDEAQDSSQLQEQILRRLVGETGNWVRVGDPNQAIFETFTTANPKYLRAFMTEPGVQARTLPNSGRSTHSIIALANHLITWSLAHPVDAVRERMPLTPPYIEPTPPDDPQGNPPDQPDKVVLWDKKLTAEEERGAIIDSIKRWLPDNQDRTVAVLLPINSAGAAMVKALKAAGIPHVENLRSTSGARAVVGSLALLLDYLDHPLDVSSLAKVYAVWRRDERGDEESERGIRQVSEMLRKIPFVEDFLAPRTSNWLDEAVPPGDQPILNEHLTRFRAWVRRWSGAVDLPVDQLILTIAGDLFALETEIATAYNAALHLRRLAEFDPLMRLPDFARELRDIAEGRRSFSGMSDDDEAFDPERHKGEVTVTTMHKAKGLEWDRVYLMSVSNYDYPSADPFDTFIGEKWFVRDSLNLDAEASAQLESLRNGTPYVEGVATQQARIDYAAERLRLLYVGITRARSDLIITWNTGRRGEQVEARPLAALRGWWAEQKGNE